MSKPLPDTRTLGLRARDERAAKAVRDAKPHERFDVPMAVLIGIAACALAFGGYFAAVSIDRSGLFDPPLVQPLPDARIMSNLRDSTAPFVGAAVTGDGAGDIAMLRADGQLALFDETTGLVSTGQVTTQLQSDIAGLSAGCGRLEPVNDGAECGDSDVLFLLSEGGGLAQSDQGRNWQTRLRDAPWTGLDGNPVTQDDVITWASSDNGRWIAIFAGAQGLAIFDQQTGLWIVPNDVTRLVEAEGPVQLVSTDDVFWLGTTRGLGRLDPREAVFNWSTFDDFEVRDLDVTPSGDLRALTQGPCPENGGVGCLAIEEVRDVNDRRVIVGEIEKIPSLSNATLRHAVLQNDTIVVVDDAGLFSYDQDQRAWRTLEQGRLDTFWIDAQTGDLTATLINRLVEVKDGQVTQRDLEGAPFTQIEVTAGGRILGLARDGKLRDLRNDNVLASREGALPDGVTFHAGASVDNLVLLASRSGILVHDVAARRFWWQEAGFVDASAKALLNPTIELRTGGNAIWMIAPASGVATTVSINGTFPTITVTMSQPVALDAPLRSFNTEADGLFVSDRFGRPFRITPGPATPAISTSIGNPRQGPPAVLRYAAGYDEGIIFGSSQSLWAYNQINRDWSVPFTPPDRQTIKDIAVGGEGLYLLSEGGQVFVQQNGAWEVAVGKGELPSVDLNSVSDARAAGGQLFFGGSGQVQGYDTVQSGFNAPFTGGRGDVRIVAVHDTLPIWLSNGELRRGNDLMTDANVRGAWQAPDGIVALAEASGQQPFAMHWPSPIASPSCTFHSASPPSGAVIDAVAIAPDRIMTATTDGIGIYVVSERRWLRVTGLGPSADLRLYVTAGQLVALTPTSLRTTDLAQIELPESCAQPLMTMNWNITESGTSVAFDPARGAALVLSDNGTLKTWSGGVIREMLAAPNTGPDPADIVQVTEIAGQLVFASRDSLWQYDIGTRHWQQTALNLPVAAGSMREVDISGLTSEQGNITVWTRTGQSYVGTWALGTNSVQLNRVTPTTLAPLRTAPVDILDISTLDGLWMIGSAAGLEVTRPGAVEPLANITFPQGLNISPTPRAFGPTTAMVSTSGDIFIKPIDTALGATSGALDALSLRYSPGDDRAWGLASDGRTLWRIAADGALLSCPVIAGQNATSGCTQFLAPPATMNASSIDAAFADDTNTYAAINGTLTLIDESYRQLQTVPGPQPAAVARGILWADGPVLWEGPGGALWRLEGANATLMADNVTQLTELATDLLAETPTGLIRFSTNAPTAAEGPDLSAASFDWLSGQSVIGINGDRFAVTEDGRVLFPLALSDGISAIATAGRDQLWVQRQDGTVALLEVGMCETPPIPQGVFIPCVKNRASTPNPGLGKLLTVENASTRTLHFALGQMSFDGATFATTSNQARSYGQLRPLPNALGTMRGLIMPNANGATELAPAQISESGRVVRTGAGDVVATLALPPSPLPAMSISWLRWDRNAGTFDLAATGGARAALTPAEFIRDGRMLLDHPGVARAGTGMNDYEWITPHSVWTVDPASLQPLLRSLIDLPEPIGLEAGRLLFAGNEGLDPLGEQLTSDPNQSIITSGGLSVQSDWRAQSMTATMTRSDRSTVPGFTVNGFRHDQRSSAGWAASGPVLATPTGIVPVNSFNAVHPLPTGIAAPRLHIVQGVTYAQDQVQWWRFDGQWTIANDPFAQRQLAQIDGVTWTLDNGTFATTGAARQGLRFDADQLLAMAATSDYVLIGTGAGTHRLAGGANFAQRGVPLQTQVPSGGFDALPLRPGTDVLFARLSGVGPLIWDDALSGWINAPAGLRPWEERRAIASGPFEVDLFGNGLPIARRTVTNVGGTQRMARFTWDRFERMPFDRVTALHVEGPMLSLGTDMGLRLLGTTDQLFDLAQLIPTGDDPVQAATRVGRPFNDPARLMARSALGDCIEGFDTGSLRNCSDPALLDQLLVVADGFWEWRKSEGAIDGAYVIAGGTKRTISNSQRSRWPHDELTAHASCGAQFAELWSDGQTLREPGRTTQLAASGWAGMHCQADPITLEGAAQIDQGLYLLSENGQPPLRYGGPGAWISVPANVAGPIGERAAGTWAYEAGRLRIKSSGPATSSYDYRFANGNWVTMPWAQGLPVMDQTLGVLSKGTDVLRITPMGVYGQNLTQSALQIDPDTILFRTSAKPADFARCSIDRLGLMDGRAHTLSALPGAPIVLRCDDGQLLIENPAQRGDIGVFQTTEDDLFAARTAIDGADGWLWTMDDAQAGRAPTLDITYRDDDVSLASGRFDLDDYRSIATPFVQQVHLVTGQGLWVHPSGQLGLPDGTRPADVANPRAVINVTSDRNQISTDPLLCVTRNGTASVTYTQTGEPREVDACFDWRGQDGLFQYRHQLADGASATGIAANGPIVSRVITDGQFADRIATGMPQPVGDDGTLLYPNALGASVMDAEGYTRDIYSHLDVIGVATLPQAGPAILTRTGVFPLSNRQEQCGPLASALTTLPKGSAVQNIHLRGADLVHLIGTGPEGAFFVSIDCSGTGLRRYADSFAVQARARHISQMRALPNATPTLRIGQGDGQGLTLSDGLSREIVLSQVTGTLLGAFANSQARGAVIVTDQEAYLLDTDAGITALTRAAGNVPADVSAQPELPTVDPVFLEPTTPNPNLPEPARPDPVRSEPVSPDPVTPEPEIPQPTPLVPEGPAPLVADQSPAFDIPPLINVEDQTLIDVANTDQDLLKAIQTKLTALGYYNRAIDGLFGTGTQNAISAFQQSLGDVATGRLTFRQYVMLMRSEDE